MGRGGGTAQLTCDTVSSSGSYPGWCWIVSSTWCVQVWPGGAGRGCGRRCDSAAATWAAIRATTARPSPSSCTFSSVSTSFSWPAAACRAGDPRRRRPCHSVASGRPAAPLCPRCSTGSRCCSGTTTGSGSSPGSNWTASCSSSATREPRTEPALERPVN